MTFFGALMIAIGIMSLREHQLLYVGLTLGPIYAGVLFGLWTGGIPHSSALALLGPSVIWNWIWRKRFQSS